MPLVLILIECECEPWQRKPTLLDTAQLSVEANVARLLATLGLKPATRRA